MTTYEPGDIVLVAFPQSDRRRAKKRPALAVLDIGDADVVLAPITTRQRTGAGDYEIQGWTASGVLRPSWIRLAKVACLEKRDVVRPLGRLRDDDLKIVANMWQGLYAFEQ